MSVLRVEVDERSYPIYIDTGLLSKSLLSKHIRSKRICLVSNDIVHPLYSEMVK